VHTPSLVDLGDGDEELLAKVMAVVRRVAAHSGRSLRSPWRAGARGRGRTRLRRPQRKSRPKRWRGSRLV
jgi:hypothetical protein